MKKDMLCRLWEEWGGILPMLPTFVPRHSPRPGCRLKLHPEDYYPYGIHRGAITERWLTSSVRADNGPDTTPDEGMSFVPVPQAPEGKVLFRDFIEALGPRLIGEELFKKYGTFPMFAKFFDYEDQIFLHIHPPQKVTERVGKNEKPEAYYYPKQLNGCQGRAPYSYFGFEPTTTREDILQCIRDFRGGDNRITEYCRGYRAKLGTGWYTPPGVVHAPASLVTYEPQWNSDCGAVFQSVSAGEVTPYEKMVENCPEEKKDDPVYILEQIDWEKSTDPDYKAHYFRPPVPIQTPGDYEESWIIYGNPYIAAKELSVPPGGSAVVKDSACYGCVVIQGHGTLGVHPCEAPTMLRFGGRSADDFFIGEQAARAGVCVKNLSLCEPLVLLKHFGPNAGAPEGPFPE